MDVLFPPLFELLFGVVGFEESEKYKLKRDQLKMNQISKLGDIMTEDLLFPEEGEELVVEDLGLEYRFIIDSSKPFSIYVLLDFKI